MNYYITQSQAMHDVYPLLKKTKFPDIFRGQLKSFQINLGYKCNQACLHCHVNAGPKRKEMMSLEIIDQILYAVNKFNIKKLIYFKPDYLAFCSSIWNTKRTPQIEIKSIKNVLDNF